MGSNPRQAGSASTRDQADTVQQPLTNKPRAAPVASAALDGIAGILVEVEAQATRGLPGFDIVGMPERAVRESKVRVLAAISSAGIGLPARRLVINLAPADVPKHGSSFDLAVACAVLTATSLLPIGCRRVAFIGELGLDAQIKRVKGLLPRLITLLKTDLDAIVVPKCQLSEAGLLATKTPILGAELLRDVVLWARDQIELPLAKQIPHNISNPTLDIAQVFGQPLARRALEIAAAGEHHLLFCGPPGCGKSMLAKRLATILPHPSTSEILEIAQIDSASNPLGATGDVRSSSVQSPASHREHDRIGWRRRSY